MTAPAPIDFAQAFEDALRGAMEAYLKWAEENWTMSADEARTLTRPVADPESYARGYAEGLASARDGLDLWLDGQL
jgi:hypothetical protein